MTAHISCDRQNSRVEAVLVENEYIRATGATEDLVRKASTGVEIRDLGRKSVYKRR